MHNAGPILTGHAFMHLRVLIWRWDMRNSIAAKYARVPKCLCVRTRAELSYVFRNFIYAAKTATQDWVGQIFTVR